jgi:hypothetical protein
MSKFTATERILVKSIVASLSIKRVPEIEIIKEVFTQTNKSLSRSGLYRVKESIKNESAKWYTALCKSENEYLHQFKERVDEIIWLQRKHYEIIDRYMNDDDNTHDAQTSLQELHKLNITLSNYYDVAPEMKNNKKLNEFGRDYGLQMRELENTKAELNQLRAREAEREKEAAINRDQNLNNPVQDNLDKEEEEKQELICYCDGSIMNHFECTECGHVWCPPPEDKSKEQKCPNCSGSDSEPASS